MPLKKASKLIMLEIERKAKAKGFRFIFGVDEAGRGPLAGPVVGAAILLHNTEFTCPVRDSKQLTPKQRERAFLEIQERSWYGVGVVNESVIDEINILRAAHFAMSLAVEDLVTHLPSRIRETEDFASSVKVLIDGNLFTRELPYSLQTVVRGDSLSLSIASASIVAKVTRDRIMEHYDRIFPQYGFKDHKGYPTVAHRAAVRKHGLSSIHRKSFRI
jgi:ribonuclease HII